MKHKVIKLGSNRTNLKKKYAKLLLEFIEPARDDLFDLYDHEDAIQFGRDCWNFALVKEMNIEEQFIRVDNYIQELKPRLREIAVNLMIRKQNKFDQYKKFITELKFTKSNDVKLKEVVVEKYEDFMYYIIGEMMMEHELENFDTNQYIPGMLDREAIVLTPGQPFIDWVNSISDGVVQMEAHTYEPVVYLIPEEEHYPNWIENNFQELVRTEFLDLDMNEENWPRINTYKQFLKYFKVRQLSMIFDIVDEPITKY